MRRPDLAALTPQAVAALSNLGLVKRAQRDAAEGKGPKVEELEDGTVVGTFGDGTVARLLPRKGLKDSPCSCGAQAVCRHRVATALAYAAAASAAQRALSPPGPLELPPRPWSPASIDDAALSRVVPARSLERARAQRERGYLAQVRRGAYTGDDVPQVSLATCSVRFLVPRELSFARCDCAAGTGCEHVALAVWAFRAAEEKDPAAKLLSVDVAGASASAGPGGRALDASVAVASALALEGAVNLAAGAATRLALARTHALEARMAWVVGALDEAEALLGAYHRRSARYSASKLATVIVELYGRSRAARAGSAALPPRAVLGMDEAPETRLDHLRLISLGARVLTAGRDRIVEVILADPSSASLLVLRRDYAFEEGAAPDNAAALGRRQALPGASFEVVARGQIVTTAATRLPDRRVAFSTRGLQRSSVTPQNGDWSALPTSIRVESIDELERTLRGLPPRFLRPRLLAEHVYAFHLGRVVDIVYAPGEQVLSARVEDPAGRPFTIEVHHRAAAPGALEATAEALPRARYLSGSARLAAHGLVVEPLAMATHEGVVVVPDFEPARASALPVARSSGPNAVGGLETIVAGAAAVLADGVHQGLHHVSPSWLARLKRTRAQVETMSLTRLAAALDALDRAHAIAKASGSAGTDEALAEAWADAALRTAVAEEHLGKTPGE